MTDIQLYQHCEEKKFADEWDGHTEKDVIARLMKCNNQNQ